MSGDDLEAALTTRTQNAPSELLSRSFFFLCAALSIVTTIGLIALLATEAAKFFTFSAPLVGVDGATAGIVEFLTGTNWDPTNGSFGVLALVSATLMVMIGSSIIALPLGLGTATYLSEYASPRLRSVLKPALEILAGIPTVVYGFFAVIYITPALGTVLPGLSKFNMLSACVVVGIMIIPMVASISEDAMSAVPDELRQAGYGMGATKLEVSTGVVVPAALSGIFSSFILALSRAIGETMAVTIAAGSTARFLNIIDPGAYTESALPMTAAMVKLVKGDVTGGGLAYRSVFAIGATLFVITLVMNIVSDVIAHRFKEEY
ncbi:MULTISPECIES: phosphate ABC transporter permease subunit PstC [Halobacterium]|uniref:Phosphate transport system permease protein n=4 Tax=Halobacterium salinarum TaxID=2242 RepID=Q9HS11_HALSA|nr:MULTISPECIES: phosphate ABC transporter permease subunit PstC [Halobacterium]AAG18997.1 phosphate ABC transporter permease [Halobacterium salinarum NRC-1]MBB6089830.1 phosphate transport system permease protein [Halobacterium salinarum]MCF2164079.1 phosphate ABC transporter permease subunit PstC [Halobacterium salinarum]MCF2167845.1 phosphate ABC transporter permease subunit PstC [Halobacterium salinarum]MCF2207680.1 phosphate ABC transporter permease subunit PstC [Halobacterium salinarum]